MDNEIIKKLKEDHIYLMQVCQGLEQLRVGNKSDIRETQVEAYVAGNKIVSDLNKYLFGFSTFLVPIIFSLSTITDVTNLLNETDILLIELSLVFLIASLISGLLHMISDYKFYKKWLRNLDRKLKLWSTISFWPSTPSPSKVASYMAEYETIKREAEGVSEEMESESSNVNLVLQGCFWLIGILLLIATIFRILP